MTDPYLDAWDWIDAQVDTWGEFLDPEEMEEYLQSQFPHIAEDNEKFWDYVHDSIGGFYHD